MRLSNLCSQQQDLHLTTYSSTVCEKHLGFDVPAIFADEQALEYFSEFAQLEVDVLLGRSASDH